MLDAAGLLRLRAANFALVVAVAVGGCGTDASQRVWDAASGARTSSDAGPVPPQCFFADTVCAFDHEAETHVVGYDGDRAFWLTATALTGLDGTSGAKLIQRKSEEDAGIYASKGHPFAEAVARCCNGDVQAFLTTTAETMGYAGSLWQKMSAVGAWARSGKRIAPQEWIAADPLIGTAGNGPDIVLPSLPLVGGDVEGSLTTNIAIAHDVDWSLGRYLGTGPLAPFLFAKRFGGDAPDAYSPALGLAGLGEVECDPTTTTVCRWYEFSAFGGAYAQVTQSHADWSVDAVVVSESTSRVEVCHQQACLCFRDGIGKKATKGPALGRCPGPSR